MTQISDFFGSYPSIDPWISTDQSLFNTFISRKQEFAELRPSLSETPPPRGGSFKHQLMAVRYLTWYDRLLLIHDPGTGKSCIITHSAELFRREYLKNPDDPTKINRAVILLRGPGTPKEVIKNEIACKCTDLIYITEKVRDAKDDTTMKGNLTRELHNWYDLYTYDEFAKIIEKFQRPEDLEDYMSNKIFYVDEAHNVPKLYDIRTAKETRTAKEIHAKQEGKKRQYEIIWHAFHSGKRNKIVLATATPMTNSPIDIIPLINLILPIDMQMPRYSLEQDEEFANLPLTFFEPYFRGRVSYIRGLVTGAQEVPIGENPEVEGEGKVHVKLFYAGMSTFQYKAYHEAIRSDNQAQRLSVFDNPRQSSNFVYPDGSYGKAGFDKYLEKEKDRYLIKNNEDGAQLVQLVRSDQGLALLSAKFSEMVKICVEAQANPGSSRVWLQTNYPELYRRREELRATILGQNADLYASLQQVPLIEVTMDDSRGIVFVYFPDYVHGSGAIMFGKCLEAHGYEEFRETASIFTSARGENAPLGPCSSYSVSSIERNSYIPKRPRYTILSGSDVTPNAQIGNILNTLNSYENRYGEYIHVIIGSRTAREGISINNASRRIMSSSSWQPSANYQANERVFRSTSHIYRIGDKRRVLQMAGLPAENIIFNVQTYNMTAIYRGDPNNADEALREPNYGTIDAEMFVKAEKKDRSNRKVLRYAKQSSYDCWINYDRNVRPTTDQDGTPICDYMKCAYDCAGIRKDQLLPLDRTTKILYYSESEVAQAIDAVIRLFSRFYSLTLDQIHQAIISVDPAMDTLFIDMAIERLIRDNVKISDRMGFPGYLRESSIGVIYLEKDTFETRDQPENTAYSSVLIGTQDPNNNSFEDYAKGVQLASEQEEVERVKLAADSPDFVTKVHNLSVVSQAKLLEEAYYQKYIKRVTSDLIEAISTAFQNSVYVTDEPRDLLRKVAYILEHRGQSRGRKPDPNKQPNFGKLGDFDFPSFDPTDVGEKIYLHTLFNQSSHERTSYSAVRRYLKADGEIRIMKPSEGIGWRRSNDYEYIVYNNVIQRNITAIRDEFERFDIYGIMIPPRNQLHIRDKENEEYSEDPSNGKLIKEGRVCNNWFKPQLVNVLYRLGLRPQYNGEPFSREAVITYLRTIHQPVPQTYPLEAFDNDKLYHFYVWYADPENTRDKICEILKKFFSDSGRLFTGRVTQNVLTTPPIGSINVAPDLIATNYDDEFNMPTVSQVPEIPSQIMPQFAASAPNQPPPTAPNIVEVFPTETQMAMPRTQVTPDIFGQMMQ